MSLGAEELQELAAELSSRMKDELYYYLSTLSEEISMIWPQKWQTGNVLFLFNRYVPLINFATSLVVELRFYVTISPKLTPLSSDLHAAFHYTYWNYHTWPNFHKRFQSRNFIGKLGILVISMGLSHIQLQKGLNQRGTSLLQRLSSPGRLLGMSALVVFIFSVRYRDQEGALLQIVRRDSGAYVFAVVVIRLGGVLTISFHRVRSVQSKLSTLAYEPQWSFSTLQCGTSQATFSPGAGIRKTGLGEIEISRIGLEDCVGTIRVTWDGERELILTFTTMWRVGAHLTTQRIQDHISGRLWALYAWFLYLGGCVELTQAAAHRSLARVSAVLGRLRARVLDSWTEFPGLTEHAGDSGRVQASAVFGSESTVLLLEPLSVSRQHSVGLSGFSLLPPLTLVPPPPSPPSLHYHSNLLYHTIYSELREEPERGSGPLRIQTHSCVFAWSSPIPPHSEEINAPSGTGINYTPNLTPQHRLIQARIHPSPPKPNRNQVYLHHRYTEQTRHNTEYRISRRTDLSVPTRGRKT
ncbi:hypothetical protein DFP72DRAFT_855335 [Ephemerocybe angulata]|uniref:DUF6533 domain-containing protein n=1 Tax=Ephemerocybe angulata TaxID=980116 RepID=A0A8H6LY80_9AGAR|nr:hypothetical protein DFP72DRAFT_855335 [Tulosesus angulatus]